MNRSESSRSFTMATWLGWQVESNWTDPFLFAIYVIIKPLATAAILVVMYAIITNGDYASPLFPYIYLGNAFYIYVGAVMTGVSWAVIEDREHYKTLKYMYIAPISIPFYWLGRGVSRFLIGTVAVFITVTIGALFFNLPLNLAEVKWGLFIVSLLIGVTMLAMIGLILASLTLMMAQHNFFIGEAVAGALYLFSGAVFPLEVLPAWIRPVGFAMPITYWLELMRRSLIGDVAQAFPTMARFSNLELLGILSALTILFGVVAVFIFRWCDHIARERGMIDRTTNY
ncbi:MAG: ABC transporter permease [Anaerolineales bacterium]